MRVFVFEFVSGGGMLAGLTPQGSLLREGAAMLRAVVADFARIPGCAVFTTWDARLDRPPECAQVRRVRSCDEEQIAFLELAAKADAVLVIAPELEGLLLDRVRQVEEVGGRLLSPDSRFVKVAGDKNESARRLEIAGVPVPRGVALRLGAPLPRDFPYPAVLKPSDGAGSQDIALIEQPGETTPIRHIRRYDESAFPWRLEQFCPGMAASIALLCGPAGCVALPACRQLLSDDGRFRYLGGETPLAPELHRRAATLAERALDALPPAIGYIGFDVVLGDDERGAQDVLIEVNPRLTTSYIGLRAATRVNLAELMLQTARSIVLPILRGIQ
jgi:predicted ATP-grasp superfamily ATP-dependent carboligase